MIKIFRDEGKMEKVLFEEYDFPIVGNIRLEDSITKDSMRSQRELVEEITRKRGELGDQAGFSGDPKFPEQVPAGVLAAHPNPTSMCDLHVLGGSLGTRLGPYRTQKRGGGRMVVSGLDRLPRPFLVLHCHGQKGSAPSPVGGAGSQRIGRRGHTDGVATGATGSISEAAPICCFPKAGKTVPV